MIQIHATSCGTQLQSIHGVSHDGFFMSCHFIHVQFSEWMHQGHSENIMSGYSIGQLVCTRWHWAAGPTWTMGQLSSVWTHTVFISVSAKCKSNSTLKPSLWAHFSLKLGRKSTSLEGIKDIRHEIPCLIYGFFVMQSYWDIMGENMQVKKTNQDTARNCWTDINELLQSLMVPSLDYFRRGNMRWKYETRAERIYWRHFHSHPNHSCFLVSQLLLSCHVTDNEGILSEYSLYHTQYK